MKAHVSDISKRIKDDHDAFKDYINKLTALARQDLSPETSTIWGIELNKTLRAFNKELEEHFALEEDGGFMDEILIVAPEQKYAISQLKSEHEMMTNDIQVILKCLTDFSPADKTQIINMKQRINALLDLLHTHESAENSIIEDTYLQDNGLSG